MSAYVPPLVMSVHGIRTHAEWQNTLGEVLNRDGIQFKNRRFGYYPLSSFVRSAKNQKQVDRFFEWYGTVVDRFPGIDLDDPAKRPSVIAHSFGSFLVGYAMLKYREMKFDKVILCGSILPQDFDWHTLFVRDQVGRVRNECGGQDVWVWLAPYFVRGTGRSGRDGFLFLGNRCTNDPYERLAHSDFFQQAHIRSAWLPLLRAQPSRFSIVHGGDVTSDEMYSNYIHRTRAIDRIRYGALPAHEYVAIPHNYSRQWRAVNPDIYTFLVDRLSGKVCGYINAMPLEDAVFEKVASGEMLDNQIPGEAVIPYIAEDTVKLYIMSIAIAPGMVRAGEGLFSEALETLLDAFLGRLRMYSRMRRIRVQEVAAVGWTPEGRRICERLFAMEQIGTLRLKEKAASGYEQVVEHPIYKLILSAAEAEAPARMHRGLRKLIDSYDQQP